MNQPLPPRRATCAACLRAQSACICGWVRPLVSPVELLILQHPLEVVNAKNSARLLHLSVAGSVLAVGEAFDADALGTLLHAGGRTPVLLYPETPGVATPGVATTGDEALAQLLPQTPTRLPETALPLVAAGVPAELLARRPDLRAAEARLRNVLASGDATRASYYPALTLTGQLGTSSSALLSLLSNPVAALGAGLSLPFLRAREMQLSGELASAQYAEAVTNFRQTLYTALADVENALSARTQLAVQGEQLALQLTAAREAERLYEVRYRTGAAALRLWLDAQERRRSAELAQQQNRLDQRNALATLYRVLGGGVPAVAGAPLQ